MTRKSVIARDVKRQKTVERFAAKRAALKQAFLNPGEFTKKKWQLLKNCKSFLGTLVPPELQEDAL